MKAVLLFVSATLAVAMMPAAHAEIYKWKDKDGSIRYSDVPPPSNIKNEALGRKIPKAAAGVTAAPAENGSPPAVSQDSGAVPKDAASLSKEEAAARRAQEADAKKNAEEVKKAEIKFRQESCAAAQNNLRTYANGGRIMTTTESGERRYLSDEEINRGKAEAEQAVQKFCD